MPNSVHASTVHDAPVVGVKEYLQRHDAELLGMLAHRASSGVAFARRRADIMDGLLTTLYAGTQAILQRRGSWARVLLGAVGGYGRGLLGWKSDLDVRFLTDESPERLQPIAEAMLYPLWDAGVSIGHQVMTVHEAVEAACDDLPTATALLDWRPLAGLVALGRSLTARAFGGVFGGEQLPRFLSRLQAEVQRRHRRFGDSLYLLEPDVKNGAGGLRDLDAALWVARARFRTENVGDLSRKEVLLPNEAHDLERAADFLWAIRNHLHRSARRRSDRLTFEEQEIIAQAFGYRERIKPDPGAAESSVLGAMAEAFMSDYYRHARVVTRACERIFERSRPELVRPRVRELDLGNGLLSVDGLLTFSDPSALLAKPALALRLYSTAVERGLRVLPEAREIMARATSDPKFTQALRDDPEAAPRFVALAATIKQTELPHDSILRELHDVGLLLAMLPEFSPVVGRVHHDVYHVYTVDVHSIAAVDRLRALARGDLAREHPLACRVAAEITEPQVLFLATLLHDVGKAIGGTDHARRGADMARVMLTRLGLRSEAIEKACHLILKHLHMYIVAVRRDIEDPVTIADFSREVLGREGLRDLYLLTIADLSTTGPTSMTPWKARMLDELLLGTERKLSGSTYSDPLRLTRLFEQVREFWRSRDDLGFLDEFLRSMPEQYLLSNTPREIASHARVALRAKQSPVTAELVPSRHADVAELCVVVGELTRQAELCVVAQDRPGLLAAISAALSASRLEVYAAQIHSRKLPDGAVQAVDLFWVRDRVEGVAAVQSALPKLERDLCRVIAGEVAPDELAKRRGASRWSERPAPPVTTEVIIDNRASLRHTVVEVITRDRPGLLYTLAQAFHELGLTISVAKINTEGARVADVFYVSETNGRKLETEPRLAEVREKLLSRLHSNQKERSFTTPLPAALALSH